MVVLAVFSDRADSRPSDLDWPSIEARGFEGKAGQVQVSHARQVQIGDGG